MLRVTVLDQDGGVLREELLPAGEHFIGRSADSTIKLGHPSVSPRHARVKVDAERITITDLASFAGTSLDGKRLPKQREVIWREGQEAQICSFRLNYALEAGAADEDGLEAGGNGRSQTPPPVPQPSADASQARRRPAPVRPSGRVPAQAQAQAQAAAPAAGTAGADARKAKLNAFAQVIDEVLAEFYRRIDLRRLEAEGLDEQGMRARVRETLSAIVAARPEPPPMGEREFLKELEAMILGLGPLEEFLADKSVDEIMVNGYAQLYVERKGRIELTDRQFRDNGQVLRVIERIVGTVGRRIDEQQPYVDARLQDGSRVHAIIPPLALNGPTLTIRKFPEKHFSIQDLVQFGAISLKAAKFLRFAVKYHKNMVVSGGTGTGKTTLLNVLSSFIPEGERIVTIEDSAELRLTQPHVVRLESKPPNIEGKGAVTIRDLVRNSLRMRPDRIVVGECRGGEALDMLQAMNTGHDGSLTTLHANTPRDALSRLETLCLMSGMELPSKAIRDQISSAIHYIVQLQRFSTGERRVVSITEVTGMEEGTITSQEIFHFRREGLDAAGKIIGKLAPTGVIPRFVDELREARIKVPMDIFSDESEDGDL